ncbi:MAG: hypothetical protein GWP10_12800 [Nitrospiraceae bacterium]|nr:hypothetical protein [Nitrospiraceae bacterium]
MYHLRDPTFVHKQYDQDGTEDIEYFPDYRRGRCSVVSAGRIAIVRKNECHALDATLGCAWRGSVYSTDWPCGLVVTLFSGVSRRSNTKRSIRDLDQDLFQNGINIG